MKSSGTTVRAYRPAMEPGAPKATASVDFDPLAELDGLSPEDQALGVQMQATLDRVADDLADPARLRSFEVHTGAALDVMATPASPELAEQQRVFATALAMADAASVGAEVGGRERGVGFGVSDEARALRSAVRGWTDFERLEAVAAGQDALFPEGLVSRQRQAAMADAALCGFGRPDRDRLLAGAMRRAEDGYRVSLASLHAAQSRGLKL